jgi:Uma2 family endonuclease
MASVATKLITAEEFAAMEDDGNLYELVKGELIEMSRAKPRHGFVCSKFDRKVGNYVEDKKLGWSFTCDTGVITERDPDTVRGPHICFYSLARMPAIPDNYSEQASDLAIEVLSPDDRASDMRDKVREYLAAGVRLIWVANPEDRTVRVYAGTMRGTELDETDILEGGEVLPGFTCKVADFFA